VGRLPAYHTASIIQLEGELDIARILGRVDETHGPSATASIRSVEIHPIKGVEEISSELDSHFLGHGEVLLQAQVDIPKSRTPNRPLGRAVSELLWASCCIGAVVEPLIASVFTADGIERCLPTKCATRARAAIRTLTARIRNVGRAAGIIQSYRESSVHGDDRVDRPSASDLVNYAARVSTPLLAAAKG
jgi:hypothetical protein